MDSLDPVDPFALYDTDPAAVAKARAQAMARVRGTREQGQGLQGAGLILRTLTGQRDPTGGALGQIGSGLVGTAQHEEDQLTGAAQHATQMDVQRQHFRNDAEWRRAMLGVNQQKADQAGVAIGLKASEVGATPDAFGNPLLYRKHGSAGPLSSPAGAGSAGPLRGGGDAGVPGMTSEALDQAAELFHRTGALPPLRGRAAAGLAVRIQNRAAELHPDADLAGNKAGYKADAGSLGKLQTQADAMDAFEQTALGNLKRYLDTARGAIPHDSPLWNAPSMRFAQQVEGDPKMTALNAARQTAVQEISKVLGGSMGNAAVSDSARHEASSLLPADASFAQIEAAAKILEADMGTRKQAVHAQLSTIRGRAGGKKPPAEAPAPASGPATIKSDAEYAALPSGAEFIGPDGKHRRKP